MATKNGKSKNLSGKKKPVQKLKNVLAYPFPQYWPELTIEQTEELKAHILSVKEQQDGEYTVTNDNILLGLSKILREINRNACVYFFLSTDIKPKFIANQIINLTLSRHKSCRVLCVPNLKTLTKFLFGIESIAFGYKSEQSPYMDKWIAEKQNQWFPIPKEILNYYRQTDKENTTDSAKKNVEEKLRKNENVDINYLYLTRSASQRAFIPSKARTTKTTQFQDLEAESTEWSDFISFSGKTKSKKDRMEVDDDEQDIEVEKQKLANTLRRFMPGVKAGNGIEKITSDNIKLKGHNHSEKKKRKKLQMEPDHSNYIGLTVNRIQANPDQVKKKKKKNKL